MLLVCNHNKGYYVNSSCWLAYIIEILGTEKAVQDIILQVFLKYVYWNFFCDFLENAFLFLSLQWLDFNEVCCYHI